MGERTDRFCGLIAKGHFVEPAAMKCGIPPSTARAWIRKGHRDASEGLFSVYYDFSAAVALALADAEDYFLQGVLNDPRGWRRFAYLLERRFPQRWSATRAAERAKPKEIAETRSLPEIIEDIDRKLGRHCNGAAKQQPAGLPGSDDSP